MFTSTIGKSTFFLAAFYEQFFEMSIVGGAFRVDHYKKWGNNPPVARPIT